MIELGIGARVADYRIEEVLGRGGMGVVYRASDERLRRDVALKVVTPAQADDPEFIQRFIDESRAAAAIDHPNVLPVYEAGEHEGILFLVARLVDGTDLAGLLRDGPLELDRAIGLVAQIAAALDAAHARGLVHRDVKPANVLVTRDTTSGVEHCYLTDFGLAQLGDSRSRVTTTGKFVGTLDYIAPEQIQGVLVDGRADVYALGALLYECLAGEPPFVRETQAALLFAHMSDAPPALSERAASTPAALDAVVARALAKAPEERFGSCTALVAAARGAISGEPVDDRAASGATAAPTAAVADAPSAAQAGTLAPPSAAARDATLLDRDPSPADGSSRPHQHRPQRRSPRGALLAILGLVACAAALAWAVSGSGDDDNGANATTAALRLSSADVALATAIGDQAERLSQSVAASGPTDDLLPDLQRSEREAADLADRAGTEIETGDAAGAELRASAQGLEEAAAGLAAIAAAPDGADPADAHEAKRAMRRALASLESALGALRAAFAAEGASEASASVSRSRVQLGASRDQLLAPFDSLASSL